MKLILFARFISKVSGSEKSRDLFRMRLKCMIALVNDWQNSGETKKISSARDVLVVGAIIYYFMGGNPLVYLAQNMDASSSPAVEEGADNDKKKFASVVLADTEDVWQAELPKAGREYRKPKLVLFRNRVDSACGNVIAHDVSHHVQKVLGLTDGRQTTSTKPFARPQPSATIDFKNYRAEK